MEELIKSIDNGWNVKFFNQLKRVDTEDGDRDFEVRVCWKANLGDKQYECEWEGFKEATDCVNDFVKQVNIISTNGKH